MKSNVVKKVKGLELEGRLQQVLELDNAVSRMMLSVVTILKRKEMMVSLIIAIIAGFIQRTLL